MSPPPNRDENRREGEADRFRRTRDEITKIVEFNCHRLAMIKVFADRKAACARVADEILDALPPTQKHGAE